MNEVLGSGSRISRLLFTLAILQLVAAGALLILAPLVRREPLPADFLPSVILYSGLLVVVLAGLGWWTRRRSY